MKARKLVAGRRDDYFESNWESEAENEQSRKPDRGTMNQSRIQMGSASRGVEEAGHVEDFLNASLHHQLPDYRLA
jgi:hypothetical protein